MLSVQKSVPTEMLNALERGGYSLHIKGRAGTGKTTLALEIVKNMSQRGKAIYLSTRVSPERILVQFPWVRGFLEVRSILDAKRSYITPDVPKKVLFEYSDQPEFLRAINAEIHRSEQRPVTVIIDSLDALKSSLNIPERDTTLESILLEIGERTSSNMLFITETDEPCRLDYLTDGVVRLEKEIIDGRLLRKLYLEKIRGGRIEQSYYLFTLKNGRFNYFEPLLYPRIKCTAGILTPKKKGAFIPTSIEELDLVLHGGLRKGTCNLVEQARGSGTEFIYLMVPIISSFVQNGFPVFITSLQTIATESSIDYIFSLVEIENSAISTLRRYIYFFRFKNLSEKIVGNEIGVSKENIEDFAEVFRKSVSETTEKLGAETYLWLLGIDTMERIFGEESFRRAVGTLVLETRASNGICIALGKHGIKSMDTVIHLATTHFIMDNVGAPIIYGVLPKTKVYAVVTEKLNETDKIDLVGIE